MKVEFVYGGTGANILVMTAYLPKGGSFLFPSLVSSLHKITRAYSQSQIFLSNPSLTLSHALTRNHPHSHKTLLLPREVARDHLLIEHDNRLPKDKAVLRPS